MTKSDYNDIYFSLWLKMENIFTKKRVACLVNPRAANSKWLRRKKLRQRLLKILNCEIHDTLGEGRTTSDKARQACDYSDIVIAMGGDGTVRDTIQGIMESGRAREIKFSVIPFGSGNAFRGTFAIPLNPKKAAKQLEKGQSRFIDLMEVNGRYAAFSSSGATALITGEKLNNRIPGVWGHILAGLKLFRAPCDQKQILLEDGQDADGSFKRKVVKSNFLDCIISKTNYFGYNWLTSPRARVDDGYLDVTLFEMSKLKYIILFPLIYFGVYQRLNRRHWKAKKVILSGNKIPVQINGEFIGYRDAVEFKVISNAIQMIIPPGKKSLRWFKKE